MQTTIPGYSWFLIISSWEPEADDLAAERFLDVYEYLNFLTQDGWEKQLPADDPRLDLDADSLRALNLIGKRQFVVMGQAKTNRVHQELALRVGFRAGIKVEVFPATNVHDLQPVMKSMQATV